MTSSPPAGTATECVLTWPQQRWNLILFAVCTGMQYLAAPVLYVGITQASLCDHLGADARTANLPGTLYFAMTAMPALIAWCFPRVSSLKRTLSLCYGITAFMLATLAITLALPVSPQIKLGMVIIQGGVSGAMMPAAVALLWEAIARGSDESRRGFALSLAFGAGPLLAVLGSFGQTMMLGGNLFGLQFTGLEYPAGFVALFAMGAPAMALTGLLAQFFIITPVEQEPSREPVTAIVGLLIGLPMMFASIALMQLAGPSESRLQILSLLGMICGAGAALAFIYHFRSILRQRVLLLATLVTVLVYAGNVIPSNMNLYSTEALGDLPEKYAGVQNLLRFSFKVVAGFFLGWILTRTNPKAGMLVTSTIFLAAQVWAIFVTGPWYLVAFGLHGAGELIGVYAPNYLVSASRRDELRRNMAFMTMLMVPAAPAGYLYGAIVDGVNHAGWTLWGINSASLGFRLSFLTCAVLILCGMILAITRLPATPQPSQSGTA